MNDSSKRQIWIDYLRVIASMAIVVLHVTAYNWYLVDVNSNSWLTFNFFDSLVRFGVPIFVMISGTLFLNKEVDMAHLFKKHILRLILAYVFWCAVYYFLGGNSIREQFVLLSKGNLLSLSTLIRGHYHMWFIPMIIGLYLCIPLLKKITENEKLTKYFLVISFFFGVLLPELSSLFRDFTGETVSVVTDSLYGVINQVDVNVVLGFSFYFVLGFWLVKKEFSAKQRMVIYILGFAGFLLTFALTYAASQRNVVPTDTYYDYFSVNVLMESVAVFVLFKDIRFKENKGSKTASLLSKYSFGVYLVHVLLIEQIYRWFGIDTLSFATYVSVPAISLVVIVGSFLISALLNLIPVVRDYLV